MPTDNVTREVLDIGLIVDDRLARKGIIQTAREFTKRFKLVEKAIEKTGKISRRIEQLSDKHNLLWIKSTKQGIAALNEKAKTIGSLSTQLEKEQALLKGMTLGVKAATNALAQAEDELADLKATLKEVTALEKDRAKAGESSDTSRSKALEEQIRTQEEVAAKAKRTLKEEQLLKKSIDETREALKAARAEALGGEGMLALEAADKIKEEVEEARKELTKKFLHYKAGEDIGEGFKDTLSSIGAKDLKGMTGGLSKILSSGAKGMGAGMARWGAKKQVDPAAGAMAKVMGKVAGSLGGMVGQLAKLGPVLSMTAGLFVAIVKLIMDAEAAAKEFNQEVLASASTVETLHKAGSNANAGYYELRDTMDQIRDSAMDMWGNLKWGISKKQHTEVLSALTSEGVAIEHIREAAEAAGKSVQDFSADVVHVSVAYARNFGVSLNEISQFQAEMMTELGTSLDTVQLQFARMTRSATESGIASNKFFAMIRAVSADLSMYNTRMEDAVGILKLLGKAMSPKEAGKYLSTLTNFFKQQSEEDRIKMMLIMGKEGKDLITRDIGRKTKGLIGDIAKNTGIQADEVEKRAQKFFKSYGKEGGAAMEEMIKKAPANMQGSLRQAMNKIAMQNKRLQTGGLVGAAEALADVGAAGVLTAVKSSMGKFTGGKKLSDMVGLSAFAARKIAGINQEQFDQAVALEKAVDAQRDSMAEAMRNPNPTDEQKAQLDRLRELGITTEAQLKAAKDDEIIAAMSQSDQDALVSSQKEINYAKEQADMLSTITDKLEVIADYLLNLVFKGIMYILDALPGAAEQRAQARMQMSVMKSGNKQLIDTFNKAEGDAGKFHGEAIMNTDIGKQVAGTLMGTASQIDALNKKKAEQVKIAEDSNKSEEERAAARAEIAKLEKEIEAKQGAYADVVKGMQADLGKYGKADQADMMFKAMLDAKIGQSQEHPDRIFQARQKVMQGKDWQSALETSGFNEEEIGNIMGKALWQLSPEQVAGVLGDQAKKNKAAAPAKPAGGEAAPAAPSAQTAATAKSSAPGTGGAPTTAPLQPASDATTAAATSTTVANAMTSGPQQKAASQQLGLSESQFSELQNVTGVLDDMDTLMRKRGIVLNKQFMSEKLQPVLEDGVLKAMRLALFEYWMYSGQDRDAVAKGLKDGTFTAADFGQKAVEYAKGQGTLKDFVKPVEAEGAQTGAIIKGVTPDGMAVVQRPPPGEGLMSGAPGEIVGRPGQLAAAARGGGGGGGEVRVKLELSQDLQKVIRAEAGNVIVASRGRERFQG